MSHRRRCKTCGWSGAYTTAKKADWAKRQHSCARNLARQLAHVNGLIREAQVDRMPQPCLHPIANHQHGTHACYVLDRCKCPPCTAANSAYEADRIRQHAYGRWNGYVDARPAREHVQQLMAAGMGYHRIADVAGIGRTGLSKLLWGDPARGQQPSRRIRPTSADKLIAVQLDLAPGARVPATGTVRRLQALVALGYSISALGRALDVNRGNMSGLMTVAAVTRRRADQVAELYDAWSMRLPAETNQRERISASRARNHARAHGWPPPLAWDDDALDNADARPHTATAAADPGALDEAAIERRRTGDRTVKLTRPEQAELVARMHSAGVALVDIERRTGVNAYRHQPRRAAS